MFLRTVKRSLAEACCVCPHQKNKALGYTAPRLGEPGGTASGEESSFVSLGYRLDCFLVMESLICKTWSDGDYRSVVKQRKTAREAVRE